MSYISEKAVGPTLVAAPTLEGTKALLAYWQGKRRGEGIPHRDDIVAAEVVPYLPNLVIAEPVDDGRDWLYRLVGTAVVSLGDQDNTGKRVTEAFAPDIAAAFIADYGRGAASREPWVVQGNVPVPGRDFLRFEAVGLPILARDGRSVWLLMGVFYAD
jgi:hypothetical protein